MSVQIFRKSKLPLFDLFLQVIPACMKLFDRMFFLSNVFLRPEPVVQEKDFSERVQKEDSGIVLVTGIKFVELSQLESHFGP